MDLVKIQFLSGNRAGVVAEMDKHQAETLLVQGLIKLVPSATMTDDELAAAVDRGDLEPQLTPPEDPDVLETADLEGAHEHTATRTKKRGK